MPRGKVEDFEGQIAPSASILDQLRTPVEEKRPADIQALLNSELDRISKLDFSFSTDNLSNDHKHSPIGTPPVKQEPSPSPSRLPEEKPMEEANGGQRSSSSRPTRGARLTGGGDAPRGRQPRQASPHDPRSRSMSSSSTDASGASSRPPHRGTPNSRNVASSVSSGSMFPASLSPLAHAPATFLHPSFPPAVQNPQQLYPQLVGAGGNVAHPPSLPPQQAFTGAQPPSQSQTSAPFTPAIFALPGVDYGNLTPQQQQMLVQVHQQLLVVAVQQQQQRQHQQPQGTSAHLPPLDLNQWSHVEQYQQQQPPNVFAGVPHASEVPSTTFPHPALTGTRHDGAYRYSPPGTVPGAMAQSVSPDVRPFVQSNLPGAAGGSASRVPASTSRGSSMSGPGPSSGDAAMHDDGDDADDAESPHASEDKRTRNTAASGTFYFIHSPAAPGLLMNYFMPILDPFVPGHRLVIQFHSAIPSEEETTHYRARTDD